MREYRQGPGPNRGGYGRPGQGGPPRPAFQAPSADQLEAIVQGGDAAALVASAETVGRSLAEMRLTTSQIRGVFATVRQIEMKWPRGSDGAEQSRAIRQLLLLKPRLAYQATRDQGRGVESLRQVLEPAINLVTTREQFGNFVDYFEAILAYHKAAGGRD